jgi:ferrous iron transport protein B
MTTGSCRKIVTVALAGAPNTGKSTVFNALTGLRQHVGNWPGKTVEKKSGICQRNGHVFSFVDLPGSYSLGANSTEEEIARDFLTRERPDVVVAIVDASSLERNLYLVCELLQLGIPLVVALNMMDVARSDGLEVDAKALEATLGVPVVPMVARNGQGISPLLETIETVADGERRTPIAGPRLGDDIEALVARLDVLLPAELDLPYPRRWALVKLLEGDAAIRRTLKSLVSAEVWERTEGIIHRHEQAMLEIASSRYDWAAETYRRAVSRPRGESISLGERADRLLTHPLGGLIAFAAVVFGIYWLMFRLGAPMQGWLNDNVVARSAGALEDGLRGWPDWSTSLLANGLIGGVGLVLTFIPVLAILFLALAILEDVGYMARAAFVMDRFMHLIGLRGKSFLPLFLGWGCNVPAIMGSRIVESRAARLTTILVAPLVPCAARMVVIALFTAAFFGGAAALVSWGMVMLNLAVLALAALLISRFIFRGQESSFVMEIPRYHAPNIRTVLLATGERVRRFVMLAGTAILAMSLVVWAFSTFPSDDIEDSILGHIGRGLAPIGGLMGLDWQMMVALLTSFVAKEQTIATLGVILGTGGGANGALKTELTSIMAPAAAVSFIALQMLFIPCASSLAAIRLETRSWRWTGFAVGYMLSISFVVAIVIYQAARLLGLGV